MYRSPTQSCCAINIQLDPLKSCASRSWRDATNWQRPDSWPASPRGNFSVASQPQGCNRNSAARTKKRKLRPAQLKEALFVLLSPWMAQLAYDRTIGLCLGGRFSAERRTGGSAVVNSSSAWSPWVWELPSLRRAYPDLSCLPVCPSTGGNQIVMEKTISSQHLSCSPIARLNP